MTNEEFGADVIPLHREPGDPPVSTGPRNYCRHRQVQLDGDAQKVTCRECGREVSAFNFLTKLAHEWERYARGVEELRRQERVLMDRVRDLKRDRVNAQAALRRAQAKLSRYGEAE